MRLPRVPPHVRTTVLYAVLFTAVEAVLVVAVSVLRLDPERRSFDNRLLGLAYETTERLSGASDWDPAQVRDAIAGAPDVLYAEVDDERGRTIAHSNEELYPVVPVLQTEGIPQRATFDDVQLTREATRGIAARTIARHVALPFTAADGDAYVLHVVARTTAGQQVVADLVSRLRWLVPLSLIAAAAVAWMLERRALRPLQDVAAAAASVNPDTLGTRISVPEAHGEIAHLQQTLNDALARIEAAFASQSRFVANVSHELRTPISVLLAESQLLDSETMTHEEMATFRGSVETEMRRLGRTVGSLLALARSEHEGRLSHAETVPLLDVAMEAIRHSAPMARQHGVRIVPRFEVADGARAPEVRGDPDLLRTMLDNLLVNAIRHSPEGERVDFVLDTSEDSARIVVSDRGPPLPPGTEERVFDRFVPEADGRPRRGAAGIGLHIAATVARLHGGRISARSGETVGSEFSVEVPLLAQEASVPPAV